MPPKSQAEQLQQLVKLQAIQAQIRSAEKAIKGIPLEVKAIEADTKRYEEEIGQTRKLEQSLESQFRSYENDIQDRASKLAQYQAQLLKVKTNIEYAALLKQIDGLKRLNEETNEQIFLLEEEREELIKHRAKKEEIYRIVKAENDKKAAEKQKELEKAQQKLEKFKGQEKRLQAKVSPGLLARFERIAVARDGVAVVSARGGICQGCFTAIRPKIFDEIRRSLTIVQCESCSRILFYDREQEIGQ